MNETNKETSIIIYLINKYIHTVIYSLIVLYEKQLCKFSNQATHILILPY